MNQLSSNAPTDVEAFGTATPIRAIVMGVMCVIAVTFVLVGIAFPPTPLGDVIKITGSFVALVSALAGILYGVHRLLKELLKDDYWSLVAALAFVVVVSSIASGFLLALERAMA